MALPATTGPGGQIDGDAAGPEVWEAPKRRMTMRRTQVCVERDSGFRSSGGQFFACPGIFRTAGKPANLRVSFSDEVVVERIEGNLVRQLDYGRKDTSSLQRFGNDP